LTPNRFYQQSSGSTLPIVKNGHKEILSYSKEKLFDTVKFTRPPSGILPNLPFSPNEKEYLPK
jgi:hypothetical protein